MQTKSYILKPGTQTCSRELGKQEITEFRDSFVQFLSHFRIFKMHSWVQKSRNAYFFASVSTMHGDYMYACMMHMTPDCFAFVWMGHLCLPSICIADICERFEVRRKGCQGINLVSCCGAEKRPLPRIKHNLPIKPPYSPPQTSINNISAVQIR